MTPAELKTLAEQTIAIGARRFTIVVPAGWRRPPGFPRCELLSVNGAGERNLSVLAHRVIEWLSLHRLA